MEFIRTTVKIREAYSTKYNVNREKIYPRFVVHDNGSEFKADFSRGLARLRERYPGFFQEKVTPN